MSRNKTWNKREIRKNAWSHVFKRGVRPWLTLVAVCAVFAILGVSEASQISFLDFVDAVKGTEYTMNSGNVKVLEDYIVKDSFLSNLPHFNASLAITFVDAVSEKSSWLIRFLGANFAYFKRNSGAVVAALSISALLSLFYSFFVQSAALVGKDRYAMECRFSRHVPFGRILAPFHRKNVFSLMRVMFCYKLFLFLWCFTIVGWFVKIYEYRFVPFLLAENPSLRWKEVHRLSKEMTKGRKWEMFLTDLSTLHIQILRVIPVVGILVTVPFGAEYLAEQYFAIRKTMPERKDIFIERAFDDNTVYANYAVVYCLKPVSLELPEDLKKKGEYSLMEYIYMFFLFCIGGWVWEVLLHLVQSHEFVNRGTMYGPWLPIYGCGGVAIIFLLDRFKEHKGRFFALAMLVCGILEFASSWILDFFFNSHYWDYKDMLFNLNGRICLVGLILFGLGGMAGVYVIAPKLSGMLRKRNKKLLIPIAAVLCVLFALDGVMCMCFGFNIGSGVGGVY